MTIGQNIQRTREERAYGQAELAREAGLSASTLWRIEHDERQPRGRTLRALAEILQIDVSELIEDKNAPRG